MSGDGVDIPMNFNAVTGRIVLGSRPQTAMDMQALRDASVNAILNVCMTNDPPHELFRFYLYNPAADDGEPKPVSWFQRSLQFALPLLAAPGNVLYVHCYDGIDRSAATVYAILRAFGLSELRTIEIIKEARPMALWRYIADANTAVATGW